MAPSKIAADVLSLVPQQPPFRFIDEITYLDDTRIEGNYLLRTDSDFYAGHFPGYPVTPGVILTEVMAQVGMVAFGIYLMMLEGEQEFANMVALLTDTNIQFKKQVLPGQQVFVQSEKILFRHGRLRCAVSLKNSDGQLISQGTMAGMLLIKPH
jgi:3-hydroxyacyl-[acyl-carrier-protein] dehydratase